MRKYFRAGLFTLAIFFPLLSSFAQSDYLMSLSNGSLINDNTYEFDILFKSTDENFELTSYQCALTFNTEIINYSTQTDTTIYLVPDGSVISFEKDKVNHMGDVYQAKLGVITKI